MATGNAAMLDEAHRAERIVNRAPTQPIKPNVKDKTFFFFLF